MLDHGVLNVPLAKRGNIDKELDNFKRSQRNQAREASKAAAIQTTAARVQAKAIVNAMTAERLAEVGKPHKLTGLQVKKLLLSKAHFTPSQILRMKV